MYLIKIIISKESFHINCFSNNIKENKKSKTRKCVNNHKHGQVFKEAIEINERSGIDKRTHRNFVEAKPVTASFGSFGI
jgi:hypothetical protein